MRITVFDPASDRLSKMMARGHLAREGHELTGYWEHEGALRWLVRTCPCADADDARR